MGACEVSPLLPGSRLHPIRGAPGGAVPQNRTLRPGELCEVVAPARTPSSASWPVPPPQRILKATQELCGAQGKHRQKGRCPVCLRSHVGRLGAQSFPPGLDARCARGLGWRGLALEPLQR